MGKGVTVDSGSSPHHVLCSKGEGAPKTRPLVFEAVEKSYPGQGADDAQEARTAIPLGLGELWTPGLSSGPSLLGTGMHPPGRQ